MHMPVKMNPTIASNYMSLERPLCTQDLYLVLYFAMKLSAMYTLLRAYIFRSVLFTFADLSHINSYFLIHMKPDFIR